ncbi:MAG: hypothetical protein ACRDRK_06295 [Pseudonocardia sp.]
MQPAIHIRPDLTPAQGRAAWGEAFVAYLASIDPPTLTVIPVRATPPTRHARASAGKSASSAARA